MAHVIEVVSAVREITTAERTSSRSGILAKLFAYGIARNVATLPLFC